MAKGSHKTYGGWEKRTCEICGTRVKLDGAGMHELDHTSGRALSLCGAHVGSYSHAKHVGEAS